MLKVFLCAVLLLMKSNLVANEIDTVKTSKKDTSGTIMQNIKQFSKKDNFLSKLLHDIFTLEREDTIDRSSNYKDFGKYSGKIIKKINVKIFDVFGESIYDTSRSPRSWLQKTGNSIHINSQDWLIKNKLLFTKGNVLIPFELTESERILRQSDNIYDARILVNESESTKDSVVVDVFVQDIWSISGDAALNPGTSGYLFLKDANFLGFGNEFTTKLKYDDLYPGFNWDGSYTWNNIDHTFLTGKIYREINGQNLIYGFGVDKEFFSPLIKWAGGLNFLWNRNYFTIVADTNNISEKTFFNIQDVWFGYATNFRRFKLNTSNQNKYNISARIVHTHYILKPENDSLNLFSNNTLILGRIGYAYRNFYKDRYILGLGKTEDIPVGSIIGLLVGYQNTEKSGFPYYGAYAGYSKFNYKFGYYYAGVEAGAFRRNHEWENGIAAIDFLFISKLFLFNDIKMRHYLWTRFDYTYSKPVFSQILDINNSNGVRGFSTDKIGNRKLVINYENNLFTPLSILGFNIGFITFADFALIARPEESLFNSQVFQGYGLGIRIKNEHLIFGTIQFMVGFYPDNEAVRNFNFFQQKSSFYDFNQFQFSRPSLISF